MKIKSALPGISIVAVMLLAMVAINGCSSSEPRPDNALVRAKAAVDQAVTAGSGQYAAVDLNTANTKLQAAIENDGQGHYKQARYLAEEAQVDAELALSKTQDAKAAEAARQVRQGNQALQNQVDQPASPPQL
jgi:hypothetical protein